MKLMHGLVFFLLLLTAGCGLSSLQDQSGGQPPTDGSPLELERSLPPLPAGDGARTISYIHALDIPGVATVADIGNVIYGASAVELLPPEGELAAVVYGLPVNGFSYDVIGFDIDYDDSAKLWFGVGDYQNGCWELTPAYTGITGVAPPYPTAHAPDGNAYFLVLAWNDATVTVNSINLFPNIPTWQQHVVDDTAADLGRWGDMALIDGHLYIAHVPWDVDEARLARATVPLPTGPADWDRTLISTGELVNRLELCEVNSLPAIAYADG